MLPFQLLAVNLISDFPMIAIATDNVDHNELKQIKKYDVKAILIIAIILGSVTSFYDFIIFSIFHNSPPTLLHTSWFIFSIMSVLVFIIFFPQKKSLLYADVSLFTFDITCFDCWHITGICLPFHQFWTKKYCSSYH